MRLDIAKLLLGAIIFLLPLRTSAQSFDHSHKSWDALLKRHVVLIAGGKSSQVNYAGMAKDRAALKSYHNSLSKVTEAEFRGFSKPQQIAFLINAYNAFTVENWATTGR